MKHIYITFFWCEHYQEIGNVYENEEKAKNFCIDNNKLLGMAGGLSASWSYIEKELKYE